MDSQYQAKYLEVAKMLWNASEGDPSRIPEHYAAYLSHTYSDGYVSLVQLLPLFENFDETTGEEFEEVVEHLSKVNPSEWPNTEDVQSLDVQKLYDSLSEIAEHEYSYVEDNLSTSEKAERTLKAALENVFGDKIDTVRSKSGRFPTPDNNFLQESDGTFAGKFKHGDHEFEFEIFPDESGWTVTYRATESTLDNLPEKEAAEEKKSQSHKSIRTRGWR
jgi:hypothetical protein